jgi:hypothetical protein
VLPRPNFRSRRSFPTAFDFGRPAINCVHECVSLAQGNPVLISPTHKRTEGRAPVCGSEFTSKDATLQGGSSRNRCYAERKNVRSGAWCLVTSSPPPLLAQNLFEESTKNLASQYFWYFWLTIQNTADRQVRNLFFLLAAFISFPLARAAAALAAPDFCCCCCAPPPHPAFFLGGGKYQKTKSPVASALAVENFCVAVGEVGVLLAF